MHICEDSVQDRLREIADELATLASTAHVPDERAYAEALLFEARRIERTVKVRPADLSREPSARLSRR
jgi:hypothetical protein